jgi:glutamate 5-kinase
MGKKLNPKRVVVKVGSAVLAGGRGEIDGEFLKGFIGGLARLHEKGFELVLVSSGAIRTGAPRLKFDQAKIGISQKQAAAAVGQGILIAKYIELFSKRGITVAQVLLTPDIVNERKKYLNARNTLRTLIDLRVIPIVNENDTVAFDEIKFGDNDRLSAISAILVEADLLINLSDVEGLCSDDPRLCEHVELVQEVDEITEEVFERARGPRSGGGAGGMATKIEAAHLAMDCGIKMVIAAGRIPRVVERIVLGEKIGTTFVPKEMGLTGRKKWVAFGRLPEGRIIVNDGAKLAILNRGKSLLPSGVIGIEKHFDRGASVEIRGPDGACFARGMTNYSSEEINKIKGRQTKEIKRILGEKISDEVVHRDDLALF